MQVFLTVPERYAELLTRSFLTIPRIFVRNFSRVGPSGLINPLPSPHAPGGELPLCETAEPEF